MRFIYVPFQHVAMDLMKLTEPSSDYDNHYILILVDFLLALRGTDIKRETEASVYIFCKTAGHGFLGEIMEHQNAWLMSENSQFLSNSFRQMTITL